MKFAMKYPKWIKLALYIFLSVSLATIGVHVYELILKIKIGANLTFNIINLSMFVVLTAVEIIMLNTKYVITNSHLMLKIGFFDITGKNIAISKIVNMSYNKTTNAVTLSYTNEINLDPIIMSLMLKPSQIESFIALIKSQNEQIHYIEVE